MPQYVDLVAFDLGNVLTFVDEIPVAAYIAERAGLSSQEAHELVFGQPKKLVFESGQQTFEQHCEAVVDSLGAGFSVSEIKELYDSVLTPDPAMFPVVNEVAASRRIALVSNTSSTHWELASKFLPFASKFDPVIVSYEVGAMKPDQAFYDSLLGRSGVPAENVLFVDDLEKNIAAAANSGMQTHHFVGVDNLISDLSQREIIQLSN
jgi:HAD superfamily hydrolase (TIGR01509 family)